LNSIELVMSHGPVMLGYLDSESVLHGAAKAYCGQSPQFEGKLFR
jgi:hypothetical protein